MLNWYCYCCHSRSLCNASPAPFVHKSQKIISPAPSIRLCSGSRTISISTDFAIHSFRIFFLSSLSSFNLDMYFILCVCVYVPSDLHNFLRQTRKSNNTNTVSMISFPLIGCHSKTVVDLVRFQDVKLLHFFIKEKQMRGDVETWGGGGM